MTRPVKWIGRMLDAVQRRFRRARPGSVLIMVVSLLVLLALIGTAAISTARLDRADSQQNVANVQVDLLAEGVKQMVVGQLVQGLFPSNESDSPATDPDSGISDLRDVILSSRLPELVMPYDKDLYTAAAAPNEFQNKVLSLAVDPGWRYVSYPPLQNNAGGSSPFKFDDPTTDSSNANAYSLPLPKVAMAPAAPVVVNGQSYPAFQMYDVWTKKQAGRFVAADTDGDGIPDSVLFRLPVSPMSGITYYGAVRVIDAGSAINVNTARSAFDEFADVKVWNATGGGSSAQKLSLAGIYSSSLGLIDALSTADIGALEGQRYTGSYKTSVTGNQLFPPSIFTEDASNGSAKARTDFVFLTPGDVLHHQLGRRLDNPDYYDKDNRFGGGTRPFGIGDAMALAYGFELKNSLSSDSVIEQALPTAVIDRGQGGPNKPYQPGDWKLWFDQNFNYPAASTSQTQLMRAYLTSYNPVRNTVLRKYPTPGPSNTPRDIYPTKTNVNTAQFEELWTTFKEVMSDTAGATPFDDEAAWNEPDPYRGMHFTNNATNTFPNTINEQHPARMFRSPLRPGGPVTEVLHPFQVLQLRAAIAAANTMALRDDNNGVVTAVVKLDPPAAPAGVPTYEAKVYGLARQPFITEVYADTNTEPAVTKPVGGGNVGDQNPSGFAAIEFHNPYDEAIDVGDWSLKVLDRKKQSMTWIELGDANVAAPVGGPKPPPTPPFVFPKSTLIPPHGYLIVWNYDPATTPKDMDRAQYLPAKIQDPAKTGKVGTGDGQVQVVPCPKLHDFIGKEVVLVRPIFVDPAKPGSVEWMPIDSFDCTGMTHQVSASGPGSPGGGTPVTKAEAWHYVRSNDWAAGRAWHFVYPGRYQAGASFPDRHIQGTQTTGSFLVDKAHPWETTEPAPKIELGQQAGGRGSGHTANSRDGGTGANQPSSFPIQIVNTRGDRQFENGSSKRAFPLHGFARVADLMEVTFIGSYVVLPANTPAPPVGTPLTGPFAEVNPVTMDAAMAEDTDYRNDFVDTSVVPPVPAEDIGRFAPLESDLTARKASGVSDTTGTNTTLKDASRKEDKDFWADYDIIVYNGDPTDTSWTSQIRRVDSFDNGTFVVDTDFSPPLGKFNYKYKLQRIRYGWAASLFDYFTAINAPADDYAPNKDPKGGYSPAPEAVRNVADTLQLPNREGNNKTPQTRTEDDVPVEGLININSANWKVLAQLPLVMQATDPTKVDLDATELLAKRIVYFRDVDDGMGTVKDPVSGQYFPHPHGPFKSIFELALVPQFVEGEGTLFKFKKKQDVAPASFIKYGDFSTMSDDPEGDHVGYDYKKRFLNLTRISNLLTTRSDCFTVYLQVQGWRDAGTANAKMVVQRRLAFIVDRSRLTDTQRTPAVYNLPVPAGGQ